MARRANDSAGGRMGGWKATDGRLFAGSFGRSAVAVCLGVNYVSLACHGQVCTVDPTSCGL